MNSRYFASALASIAVFLFALSIAAAAVPDYQFTTLAGSAGIIGSVDGAGSAARFNDPASLAVDTAGNVYVADRGNHTIRKITPSGVVTTLAGLAGSPGNANGTGGAARFNYPDSVAVDSTGTVYVGESQLGTVRKITPAGVVTAVTPLTPYYGPFDIAVDVSDDLFAAAGYDGIVKVMPTGEWARLAITSDWSVKTLAIDPVGNFVAAVENEIDDGVFRFPSPPHGAYVWSGPGDAPHAIDGAGNIYTAFWNEIGLVTPGVATAARLAGASASGSTDGPGLFARFKQVSDIAVDRAGNLYVVDRGNHTVRMGTPTLHPPVITSTPVATGVAGRAFHFAVTTTTAATSVTTSVLPAGLTFNEATGVISGAPTLPGTYEITITAMNADGTSSITLTLTVEAPSSYIFTTLAGDSGQLGGNGTGGAARFRLPSDVVADGLGNIYVADSGSHTIRKITREGIVSNLAGLAGFAGSADGTGSEARFNSPSGLAADATGNVYVADAENCTIRKITPDGAVTTLAGLAGSAGSANGTGSAARFNHPAGVAVDTAGNLLVADTWNSTIRKITPVGAVTTLAGYSGITGEINGTGPEARFSYPQGIAVDGNGTIYVADSGNYRIRKVTAEAVVTTAADGLSLPYFIVRDIAVDSSGNLFIGGGGEDEISGDHSVTKFTPAGGITTFAGGYYAGSTDGTGKAAAFNGPLGIALDPEGNVLVADSGNGTIRKVTAGRVVTTIAGSSSRGSRDGTGSVAQFNFLYGNPGVAVDAAGNLFVSDSYNQTIRRISATGAVITLAGSPGNYGSTDGAGAAARFRSPSGVAVDATGSLFVADSFSHTIRKITPAGVVTTYAGIPGTEGARDGQGDVSLFRYPEGVAIDTAGNLYVADSNNSTIRKISPGGLVSTLAGLAGSNGDSDGPGSAARFRYPNAVAVDAGGTLYVADTSNNKIRKITPDGDVTTLAGSGAFGDLDGPAGIARFDFPRGVSVDSEGNVFVTQRNGTIRMISPVGIVSTVGGLAGSSGAGDGLGTAARFTSPSGVAVDAHGTLFITDAGNNTIRKGVRVADVGAVPSSRLVNASVRANLIAGRRLIPGFVMGGGVKSVLVRAIGPGLESFMDPAEVFASNPRMELYDTGGSVVATNDDWSLESPDQGAALAATFESLGAFPLAAGSADAALLRPVSGAQTAHVLTTSDGIGLVELYDAGGASGPRLVNYSARYFVGTGANVLILGFVTHGSGEKTLLIRGVGPGMGSPSLLVPDTLDEPLLQVFNVDGQRVAESNDWAPSLASISAQVGAFTLRPGSPDSAILLTLPSGLYTAILSGADGGTGEGLIEVYEVQ